MSLNLKPLLGVALNLYIMTNKENHYEESHHLIRVDVGIVGMIKLSSHSLSIFG